MPCELGSANRDLIPQVLMGVMAGERRLVDRLSEASQFGDKCVLKGRLIFNQLADRNSGRSQLLLENAFPFFRFAYQQVKAVAEALHIENLLLRTSGVGKRPLGRGQIFSLQLQPFSAHAGSQLRWGPYLVKHTLMHERHAVTS